MFLILFSLAFIMVIQLGISFDRLFVYLAPSDLLYSRLDPFQALPCLACLGCALVILHSFALHRSILSIVVCIT